MKPTIYGSHASSLHHTSLIWTNGDGEGEEGNEIEYTKATEGLFLWKKIEAKQVKPRHI